MRQLGKSLLAALLWSGAWLIIVGVAHETGFAFQNLEEAALMTWGAILMNLIRIGWEAV